MVKSRILTSAFYERDTVRVAPELLGKNLVRVVGRRIMVGRIVEVEAYGGKDDPASHAYRGLTRRNAPMFGEPGHAYVYFTYGNHYCLNITTQKPGTPGAVLLRAIQPVEGIGLMRRFRSNVPDGELTNGPGKLTKSLHVDKTLNGQDMTVDGPLFVTDAGEANFEIWRSLRIGVSDGGDQRWRFYIHENPYVTRRRWLKEGKFP